MTDLILAYLAILVKRDGDKDLQVFYNIETDKVYSELQNMANAPREHRVDVWRVPVIQTIDIFASRHNLDYIPWR